MSVAALAASIAQRQHGAIHLDQLRAAGATADAVDCAVATGEIVRRRPSVYAVAGAPPTWRQEVMAACLDAGPGSAASHRTGATLNGLARRGAPQVIEISIPRPASARMSGVVVHRSRDLTPEHVIEVDGIPCTGPLRTLVDLGAVEPRWEVRDAVERSLSARIVTLKGLEWAVTEHSRRGRNGVGVLRWVLDERALGQAMPDSVLEARMARIYRQHHLPPPEFQYEVRTESGLLIARVDFAYPFLRHAFEVDGWEHHSTPQQTEADYDREHRLRAAGWSITRFTYWHVVKRPSYVAEVIAGVLGASNRALHG